MATYAIVKTGGQYKVAQGDIVKVEKIDSAGHHRELRRWHWLSTAPQITTDADALAKISVTAEVVEETKGPKIRIHKFKNKTGYHKRQGHRRS